MIIYIVKHAWYDFECSGEENLRAFIKKEDAEKFRDKTKADIEHCREILNTFQKVTEKYSEPYMKKIRTRSATEEELQEYHTLIQERYKRKQKLYTKFAEEDRIWYEGHDEYEILIDELECDFADLRLTVKPLI